MDRYIHDLTPTHTTHMHKHYMHTERVKIVNITGLDTVDDGVIIASYHYS